MRARFVTRSVRGFTLVEVLVALVIVAAGAAAVLSSLNTAAMSTVYLRDKTFAGWVADNRIAETRLLTTPPASGVSGGEIDYAGQRWQWRQQITDGAIPGLRRIDVSVRPVVPGAPASTTGLGGGGAGAGASGRGTAPTESTAQAGGGLGEVGAAATGPEIPGDWTITLSAVIGRDLSQPGMASIDWEPPPAAGAGGGAGAGAGGGTGAADGSSTPTRPEGGPRFGQGPRT